MQSKATTVEQYLRELPEDRRAAIAAVRAMILKNLDKGFREAMSYGMIGYAVPHSIYPPGYHCDPKQPLPFLHLASQKQSISVYHLGLYAEPALLAWFTEAHAKASPKKLDMGKSCIRYKKPEDIPYELLGELAAKMTPQQWIERYEQNVKPPRR